MDDQTLKPDTESIRQMLRAVIDPEVGVNIVDLGLIYGLEVDQETVRITMTMTSPACPMADMIIEDIDRVLDAQLPTHLGVDLKLVWEPPWTPDMMHPDARDHFGWNR